MKALIHYSHGLGDVIMLTPLLRKLNQKGYKVDLMCRQSVETSKLLDECPYVERLFIVDNPHRSKLGWHEQQLINDKKMIAMSGDYDYTLRLPHLNLKTCKITHNMVKSTLSYSKEDLGLEVFIPKEVELQALNYIQKTYPNGYIFNHTQIEFHPVHNWNSMDYIKKNLPDLPVIDTGLGGSHYRMFPDINFSFVLAREAEYRVLSSSVFVHACEAMGSSIEIINYGKPDRKVWPLTPNLVKHIRESEKMLK